MSKFFLDLNKRLNFSLLCALIFSIGAKKVKDACSPFREYCNAGNAEG